MATPAQRSFAPVCPGIELEPTAYGRGAEERRPLRTLATLRSAHAFLVLVFALSLALGPEAAEAWRGWCRRDPEFRIAGQTAHVRVAVDTGSLRRARRLSTGEPIRLVLTVPVGTRARYLASDNGFGAGYDVRIEHASDLQATTSSVPVRVAVFVPMSDPDVQVHVTLVPAGDAGGGGATPHQASGKDKGSDGGNGNDRGKDSGKGNGNGRSNGNGNADGHAVDGPRPEPTTRLLTAGSAFGAVNTWVSFTTAP